MRSIQRAALSLCDTKRSVLCRGEATADQSCFHSSSTKMWHQSQVTALASYGLLLLLLISCLLPEDTAAGQASHTKCAALGEYCQNHWDCCSNSCLSYRYRCTRSYQNIYPYPFLSPQYVEPQPPSTTKTSYLDLLNDLFGNTERQQSRLSRQSTTEESMFLDPRIDLVQIVPLQTTSPAAPNNAIVNEIAKKESADESAAKVTTTYEYVSEPTTAEKVSNTTDAVKADAAMNNGMPKECKEIGLKCYRNEECCSMRCHGYLHQCVT